MRTVIARSRQRVDATDRSTKSPMPISVSRTHFALRYEVPKFLARGGHLCMAMLTIAVLKGKLRWDGH